MYSPRFKLGDKPSADDWNTLVRSAPFDYVVNEATVQSIYADFPDLPHSYSNILHDIPVRILVDIDEVDPSLITGAARRDCMIFMYFGRNVKFKSTSKWDLNGSSIVLMGPGTLTVDLPGVMNGALNLTGIPIYGTSLEGASIRYVHDYSKFTNIPAPTGTIFLGSHMSTSKGITHDTNAVYKSVGDITCNDRYFYVGKGSDERSYMGPAMPRMIPYAVTTYGPYEGYNMAWRDVMVPDTSVTTKPKIYPTWGEAYNDLGASNGLVSRIYKDNYGNRKVASGLRGCDSRGPVIVPIIGQSTGEYILVPYAEAHGIKREFGNRAYDYQHSGALENLYWVGESTLTIQITTDATYASTSCIRIPIAGGYVGTPTCGNTVRFGHIWATLKFFGVAGNVLEFEMWTSEDIGLANVNCIFTFNVYGRVDSLGPVGYN